MPAVINERWQALSEHFDQVIELSEPQRAEWLAILSQTDPEMAGLVATLLGAGKRKDFAEFRPLPVAAPGSVTDRPRTLCGQWRPAASQHRIWPKLR